MRALPHPDLPADLYGLSISGRFEETDDGELDEVARYRGCQSYVRFSFTLKLRFACACIDF
jgi:hypothetical protein